MANTDIGKAYVQIVPSMQGIKGSITSLLSGESKSAGTTSGSLVGSSLLTSLKKALPAVSVAAAAKGLVSGISDCISEYADFDQAMSQVAATMGTTKDEISDLTAVAKEMGSTTAFTAEEAAEGLNILAMAGLDADEQIAVLPQVLDLASAGALSLESAASYVTGAIKGFGDSMDNAQYYADLMAKGATLANTSVEDLGEALSGSAATASSYGQDVDSVTLSLLKLAEQNVTGSEAATALNRAMADLYTPTDAAKGALDELGVACYDANGNARDFNDVCDDLQVALAGYDQETQNAYKDTIFTTQGLSAFNKMAVTSTDTAEEFAAALADSTGSASEQAATQLDNLNGSITLFESALSGLKMTVGSVFEPIKRGFVDFGTSALTAINDVLTGTRSVGEVLTDFGTSVSEAITSVDWLGMGESIKDGIIEGVKTIIQDVPATLAEFATTVSDVLENTDWYSVGHTVAETIINGLISIVTSIPGHVMSIVNAITQVIRDTDWAQVGYDAMTFMLTGLKNIILDIPEAVGDIVMSIWDVITETDWIELGGNIVQGIIDGITGFIGSAVNAAKDLCSGLFESITDFFGISSPSTLMMEQGEYIVEGLTEGMDGMAESVDAELQATLGVVDTFGADATSSLSAAGSSAVAAVSKEYSQMPKTIDNPLSGAMSDITSWGTQTTQSAQTYAQTFTTNVTTGLSTLPSSVQQILTSILANVTSWGTQMTQQATTISKNFVTSFINGWSDFQSKVSSKLDSVTTTVKEWGTSLASTATTLANNFVTNFTKALSSLNSEVKSVLKEVNSTVKGYGDTLNSSGYSIGQSMVNGMISGLNSKSSSLYSTVKGIVNSAISQANAAAAVGSPSKKTMWTGQMLGEGLAVGITDEIGAVSSAMDRLIGATDVEAGAIRYNASAFSDGTRAYGSGTVINFTQNIYSQKQTAADQQREAKYEAQRAVIAGCTA